MMKRLSILALPLALTAACGGGDSKKDPDADTSNADAGIDGGSNLCPEFASPIASIDTYPGSAAGDLSGAGANFQVTEGQCADERSWFEQPGEDDVVALTGLTPGSEYVVTVDSAADISFYVATGCTGTAIGASECMLFVDETVGGAEVADFVAPESGSVFVVVDQYDAETPADASFTISVYEPECANNDDCSGTPDTPYCSGTRFCVECDSPFHCPTTDDPVCDFTNNTCGPGFDSCTGDDATESGDDGPAGAVELTPAVDAPDSVDGNICSEPAAEVDFFMFTVAEGEARVLELDWEGDSDIDLYLLDSEGNGLASSELEQPEIINSGPLTAGTYYVFVSQYEPAATAATTAYTLTATVPECLETFDCTTAGEPVCGATGQCEAGPAECTDDDANEDDDGPAAATLTNPAANADLSRNGSICNTPSNETDWYRTNVTVAGDNLVITVDWPDADTTTDLDLAAYDAEGRLLGMTYWKKPEVVELTNLPTGAYYFEVRYFGAAITAAADYTINIARTNTGGCTTAADCAAEHSTQFYRGSCAADACSFIEGADALTAGAACDSGDDCESGFCSYKAFQANADSSVCTVACSASSECTSLGADFECTVPFGTNFCSPPCATDLDCGANPGSSDIELTESWDYLSCDTGTGACDL